MLNKIEVEALFLTSEDPEPVYVYGRNEYARNILKIFSVKSIVDDFTLEKTWEGYSIIRSADLPFNSVVISCITNAKPITALENLNAKGIKRVIDYFKLSSYFPEKVKEHEIISNFGQLFKSQSQDFNYIYSLLSDCESREIFNSLIHFRLTGDLSFMYSFSFRPSDQYFEDFLPHSNDYSFVDCGSYDGFTSLEFIKFFNGNFKYIHIFEPDTDNFIKCKHRLNDIDGVIYNNIGVSDVAGVLKFNPNNGSSSKIDDNGESEIKVIDLDSYFSGLRPEYNDKIFIKMDLEGFEMNALKGAKDLISKGTALLAIAVYHSQSDIIEIPKYILSLNKNYKIFLRHYTESWTESVMYFIPDLPVLLEPQI